MINKINKLKIYYKGISSDIKGIKDMWEVCIKKNIKFYKRMSSKQIIMTKPKERYVIDLTFIPNILSGNSGYKYLFNILDHFSKFLISYAIKDKAGKTIAKLLNKTFKKYSKPEQLLRDNGSEFINKKVKTLVDKEGISFIHSKPYNPHSQGTVERVHRTVRDALICKFLENSKKFNLIYSLTEVVSSYNNTTHKTIKYKPFTIFYNGDENSYKEVFENTVSSQKIMKLM
jgi:transposase InsO family protein